MTSETIQPANFESGIQTRNAIVISSVATLLLGAAGIFIFSNNNLGQLWTIAPLFFAAIIMLWLSSTNRHTLGSILFILVLSIETIISPTFVRGTSLPSAIGALALIGGIGVATLPKKYFGYILFTAVSVSAASIFLDVFAQPNRPPADFLLQRWVVSVFVFVIFSIYFSRQFFSLGVQTKIVLGILITGGLALGILAIFSISRTLQITNNLSRRLNSEVETQARERLANIVAEQSTQIDGVFAEIAKEMQEVAGLEASLREQRANLSLGTYWDSRTRIFQLPGGQYGNSQSDPSSVFIPVNTVIDDDVFADLNTSAHLDFAVPNILESNPLVLAIYYIDPRGLTRYYPNINLASVVPPDFDATSRPYYEITAPLFNSKRLTRWTIPYVDAAGGGLVVTVAAPVYNGNQFNGVVAADIQLSRATEQVTAIQVGQTGFAFMIDDAGRIIAAPPAGYKLFNINPDEIQDEDFFKQTVLGSGDEDINSITRRMVQGGNGINIIKANGVDAYIAYAPIPTNGYNLAIVVPVAEMQQAITEANFETQSQIRLFTQEAVLLFAGLLLFAIIISVLIGRVIATPIVQLTNVANEIVKGNINAQSTVSSQDEIGSLSNAFNTMTLRLRETLEGLEKGVQERTTELVHANQRIEKRAKQFASISEISRVINQTQSLQDLLPQITQVISEQLGFYHVGIFLINSAGDYAELVAANSEGGQRMLARNHRLRVGQVGIVGNVANTGIPRIALDTGDDAIYFDNPDLPDTHSEMALPLVRAGNQLIGILDVQSTQTNAFAQEDIQILSTLAEQVSIAITNSRLYEETQRALIEADMIYRGELRSGWQKFTRNLKLAGIRRKGTRSVLLSEPVNVPGFEAVTSTGNIVEVKPHAGDSKSGYQITLPIKLRGEIVGVLNLRTEEEREWTQDQMDVINAILERAALSVESSRLLLESQKQAAKERIIGQISAKVSSFTNRNNILQAAAEEIGRALPGAEVVVQIQKSKNGNNHSGEKK